MTEFSRGKINYSEKLSRLVSKFKDEPEKENSDHPSNHLDVAGNIIFDEENVDEMLDYGFEMAMKCPSDLMVFSGTQSSGAGASFFVFAKDEADALRVWREAAKNAKAKARKTRHREF
jgi:hypothetical protein